MAVTGEMRASDALAKVFGLLEEHDVDGALACFADDALFIDPHYPPPIGPVAQGKEAIRRALEWAFAVVEQFHFDIRHVFESHDPPTMGAVEAHTPHALVGGTVIDISQVFVADINGQGFIVRLQSYCPYPPPPPPE